MLAFDAERVTVLQPVIREGRLTMIEAAQIPLTGDSATIVAAGRAALAPLARVVYGGAVSALRVVVALPHRQVLRRTLTLPAAVEENLRQALAYDLDRHTPFKAEELYFDAVVVGRDAARGEIRVDLAAARRAIVDQAVRYAKSFGASVAAVVPDVQGSEPSRLNLLADSERQPSAPWARWQFWVPIALLVCAALAAVVVPLWQKRAYAIALARATDEARGQAAVSESLRAELDKLTADYNFVLERKYQFPPDLEVLHEVTKLLPDDTWLLQMEVKSAPRAKEPQRELLLRGESANAGRLISAFEESKAFMQAAPRSPITKIQPGPGEIFDLAAQVRPVSLPVPQPLAPAGTDGAAQPGTPAGAPPAPATATPASGASAGTPSAPATATPTSGQPASGQPTAATPGPAPAAAPASPRAVAPAPVPPPAAAPMPEAATKATPAPAPAASTPAPPTVAPAPAASTPAPPTVAPAAPANGAANAPAQAPGIVFSVEPSASEGPGGAAESPSGSMSGPRRKPRNPP